MPTVTDTLGNPLTHVALVMSPLSDSSVVVARVECRAGLFLAATSEGAARVLARRTGSGSPFVDLSTSPISLTEFDGTTQSFDFKVSAGAVSAIERDALSVRVTFAP
jgi:hypothetical protein